MFKNLEPVQVVIFLVNVSKTPGIREFVEFEFLGETQNRRLQQDQRTTQHWVIYPEISKK
jgi:hypothetical protein